MRKKLPLCVILLRQPVGLKWGASDETLRTATLSLVYSTAEYCMPVWCRSDHTRFIENVLNDALRIVTGCLHPTLMDHLPAICASCTESFELAGLVLGNSIRPCTNGS